MYLTVKAPQIVSVVSELVIGIWPGFIKLDGKLEAILIVKMTKEGILTAAMNKEFFLYLAPCNVDDKNGLVLLSAFYDDEDEPLVITTPIIAADQFQEYFVRLPNQFIVGFFDELNREMLTCKATTDLEQVKKVILSSSLLPLECARQMMEQAQLWFGSRSKKDDQNACIIRLHDDLFPNDFVFQDLSNRHNFHGSSGFSTTSLRREEPGLYQELDIIFLLQRVFAAEKIFHGPLKVSDGEELVDILVLADEAVLLIQAKDSPNTEKMLKNKISRKRTKSKNKLAEGFSQLKGAVSTIRNNPKLKLKFRNSGEFELDFTGRQLIGVVIVKELFNDTFREYSRMAFDFMEHCDIPSVFFEYSDFGTLTRHCAVEDDLFNSFHQLFNFAKEHGEYPRLRFLNPPPDLIT